MAVGIDNITDAIRVRNQLDELLLIRWRQDRLPLLVLVIGFVVMTWPFMLHMHDTLPINNDDTHTALWQNWWMREALIQGYDINYSQLLFHPNGLDVSLQPRRWTTFPLWTVLYTLIGEPLAFNLVVTLGIIFKAYGMYLVGLLLFKKRLPALVASAYFAFNAYSLRLALESPNSGASEWIPWFMLFLMLAMFRLREGANWRAAAPYMLLAALCFALNLYMSLKLAILAMLLGGSYVILYILPRGLWRRRDLWLALMLFSLTAAVLSAPLLLHTLGSEQFTTSASYPVREEAYQSIDFGWQWFRLGIMSLIMALLGVAFILRWRRSGLLWLALAVIYNVLSLGISIHIFSEPISLYWTPYRILQDNFFFRTLNYPIRMTGIFVFAWSLLIGYGFCLLWQWLGGKRSGLLLMALLAALTLFDTRIFPIALRQEPRSPYVDTLDELEPGALINVPFGTQPAKYYMSLQRYHGRPIVEGMIARMPVDAYAYIETGSSLAPFLQSRAISANPPPEIDLTAAEWQLSIDQLITDGFRYLVLHNYVLGNLEIRDYERPADWVLRLFGGQETVYSDAEVSIFDLLQLDTQALEAASHITALPPID